MNVSCIELNNLCLSFLGMEKGKEHMEDNLVMDSNSNKLFSPKITTFGHNLKLMRRIWEMEWWKLSQRVRGKSYKE